MAEPDKTPLLSQKTYKSKSRILAMVLTYALSTFYFGYSLVYFGAIPIETPIHFYKIKVSQAIAAGVINGCVPIGALFGALLSVFLIANFSRRHSILLINAMAFFAGSILFVPNFYILALSRLMQGICVGCYSSMTSMIIKEISPVQISGLMGSMVQVSIVSGQFSAFFLVYILKKITGDLTCSQFWPVIFAVTLGTIVAQSLLLLFVFPFETPKYWLLKNREDKALQVIEKIYLEQYVEEILQSKKRDLGYSNPSKVQEDLVSSVITAGSESEVSLAPEVTPTRKVVKVVAFSMALVNQLCGASAVDIYCGPIARKSLTGELVILMPSIIIFSKLLSGLLATRLLKRYGRKRIFLPGLCLIIGGLLCMGVGFLVQDRSPMGSQNLVMIGLFAFTSIFGCTIAPVVWLYTFQILSQKHIWKVVCCNWSLAAVVVMLFPILEAHLLDDNPGLMFIFFAACILMLAGFNYRCMVETKNKTEYQIRRDFENVKICCFDGSIAT